MQVCHACTLAPNYIENLIRNVRDSEIHIENESLNGTEQRFTHRKLTQNGHIENLSLAGLVVHFSACSICSSQKSKMKIKMMPR